MTPIKKGTAARLGLRKPISARVIRMADQCGFYLEDWQKQVLVKYYRPDKAGRFVMPDLTRLQRAYRV